MNPLRINTFNYECVVKHSDLPVLLVFGAMWDYNSRRIYEQLDDISKKLDKKLITGKVELDYNTEIFADLDIADIPTMIIFENGEIFEKRVGCKSSDDVRNFVYRFFGVLPY